MPFLSPTTDKLWAQRLPKKVLLLHGSGVTDMLSWFIETIAILCHREANVSSLCSKSSVLELQFHKMAGGQNAKVLLICLTLVDPINHFCRIIFGYL